MMTGSSRRQNHNGSKVSVVCRDRDWYILGAFATVSLVANQFVQVLTQRLTRKVPLGE